MPSNGIEVSGLQCARVCTCIHNSALAPIPTGSIYGMHCTAQSASGAGARQSKGMHCAMRIRCRCRCMPVKRHALRNAHQVQGQVHTSQKACTAQCASGAGACQSKGRWFNGGL